MREAKRNEARAGSSAGGGRERGETALEYILVVALFTLPLLITLPLILDMLFRHYAMISYVLLQPGP